MLIEAFDTLVHADAVLGKLRDAQKLIARKQLTEEKQWLQVAVDRLAAALAPVEGLATRSAQLPELEPVRGELAKTLQHGAIDAVERLQAGITFHAGPRAALCEELFRPYKLTPLRRAAREDFEKFTASFSKRLKTQYTRRMLAAEELAAVQPVVTAVTASFDAWRAAFAPEPLAQADADKLRAQLTVAADTLAPTIHQAKLLAEAALTSVDGAFADLGLAAKPKKRAGPKAVAPAPEVEVAPAEVAPEVVAEAAPKKGKQSRSAV